MDVNVFGVVMDIGQYLQIIQVLLFVAIGLLGYFWICAGKWMWAYGKAKLTGGKVAIEYDKTKEYNPYVADIPKDWRAVIKLPGKRGVVGIRREGIGHSNKTQTMLFSTEFEYVVSPTEIAGDHYYSVDPLDEEHVMYGYFMNEQFTRITPQEFFSKERPDTAKMWLKYPIQTLVPEEFVKYQQINGDPMITEHYAQHKEAALQEKINNPLSVMLAQHGWIIIALLIAGAVAYQIVQQQNFGLGKANELQSCKDTIIAMYNSGQCRFTNITTQAVNGINITKVSTGGMIQ
jgi:hypothetical protein